MKKSDLPESTESNPYRELPAVNELLEAPSLAAWMSRVPRSTVATAVRQVLDQFRQEIAAASGAISPSLTQLIDRVNAQLQRGQQQALTEVINGTGILLHTGLGRAPLSSRALAAVAEAAAAYTAIEMNLVDGQRGRRVDAVREQLCAVTGAEGATVVNNNAAALLITLATLSAGKEVIVSRGELIEIGGSFRLPEVMTASGARLREVGTTNKTRIVDYACAITEATGALLKVHPSNYRITGFTQSAAIDELAALGRKHDLLVVHDIGSGALFDLTTLGLGDEPVARNSIEAGADVVLFSGDKLLGGPQAGIVVGRRQYIERIERHPLMRALRVDKLTLAALSATLMDWNDPQLAARELPLWRMITAPLDDLQRRAHHVVDALRSRVAPCSAETIASTAYLGGGSLPSQGLPSVAVAIASEQISEEELARRLRAGSPAVVGRLQAGRLLVDMRAVLSRQDESLVAALAAALENCGPPP